MGAILSFGLHFAHSVLVLSKERECLYFSTLGLLMNSNIQLALGLAGVTFIWMLSGYFAKSNNSSDELQDQTDFSVQVTPSLAADYAPPIYIRARTEAERDIRVMAEVDGLVANIWPYEGQLVEQGTVLCALDKEDRSVRLAQARAQLAKAKIDYEAALALKDSGFQSRSQIASAKASLALAEAELERTNIALDKTQILAPFRGVLERSLIQPGDFLQRGQPCAHLLELDPIIVSGEVSESAVKQLQVGSSALVKLDDVIQRRGVVRYLAKSASNVTRSYRVEVALANPDLSLLSGMTAEVIVRGISQRAHFISSSLLTLLDDGKLGVRAVDENNIVQVHSVALIGDQKDGIWVAGLPETVRLIVVGQEYVSEGQSVQVVAAEAFAQSASEVAQ